MRFKDFLLNENRAYLGQKVGDILSALQQLRDEAPNMGSRSLTEYTVRIVNLIRRVLHSSWPKDEEPNLIKLQNGGVALMKAIDEKGDLPGMITAVASAFEKLVADLGVPVNKLTPTETPKDQSKDAKSTAGSENKPPPPTPPQAPAADAAPQAPQTMDTTPQGTPPTGSTGQDMAAPPLGGSSGPLSAF